MCVALMLVLSSAARVAIAHADCVDDCIMAYGERGTEESTNQLLECYRETCNQEPKFGAIAYAKKNGAYGFSYDVNDSDTANQRALNNCAKNGDGCKLVISFSNTCAALAAGDNERFATSLGNTKSDAQSQALAECGRDGGKNCDIKAWSCARPQ